MCVQIYILSDTNTKARLNKLYMWKRNRGILLIGYEMYRNLVVAKRIKRKADREKLAEYLLDPGPDIVVCDEGHVMRNSKSNLSLVLNRIRTRTRIVLTGTPLQNNLLECKICVCVCVCVRAYVCVYKHSFFISTTPNHILCFFLSPDYTMVNFVKPNLLGTQREFVNRFANPIRNGQCRDSNPHDIRNMKQRAHVLYKLLQGSVQVS